MTYKEPVTFSPTFLVLAVLFCVSLIVANLMEIKVVDCGFLSITAGVVVFPISYIINDCIVEIYGFAKARFVIWLGFAMNLLVSLLLQLGIMLPGGAEWQHQAAMEVIYGAVPRIFAASFLAFICGSMVNAYVMSVMQRRSATVADPERGFSVRAILSTVFGEGVDSLLFFPIAFGGVFSVSTIIKMILTQTLLKTAYEIIVLPLTVRIVKRLRKVESPALETE